MDQYSAKPQVKAVPQQPESTVASPPRPRGRSRRPKKLKITLLVIILIVVLAAGAGYKLVLKKNNTGLVGVNGDQYQALFLTNGQVYFGKLKAADSKTIQINDIFYLQVQQAVQPKENEQTQSEQQGETQLVKLGQELHGPQDEMFIDRSQVLFWENLKDDGKVVKAIKDYKK